jgi:hypothetical protein
VTTSDRHGLARLGGCVAGAIRAATLFAAVGLVNGNVYAGEAAPDDPNPSYPRTVDRVKTAEVVAVPAQPRAPPEEAGWIDWNGDNFFGPCRGDCAFSLYGGKEVTSSMERMFFVKYPPLPPWKWRWGKSEVVAGAFSRRLVTFWNALSLEPEVGVGQRFGDMHATEFWGALNIRWSYFPWNDYLKTSIALSEGLSMTTEEDNAERLLNNYKVVGNHLVFTGSQFLNFFSPEITFALPQYEAYELLVRYHHRSGVFGTINGVHAGAQFFTTGLRIHF